MTKADLAVKLAEACTEGAYKKADFKRFLDTFEDVIPELLVAGETVNLNGIGTLKVAEVKERVAYNPNRKQKETIPAHKRVKFTQSATIRKTLRG